jgi:adenylate cyclase
VDILGQGFWLFAVPLGISLALGIAATLFTLNRRPDRAEALRLKAFVIASPFMASGMVLPIEIAPLSAAIGLLIFLVGAVQYHVTQGRRAQFMARFLAPQVAALVNERGLKSATDEQTLEITVVCCDLRGFTAFTAATSSSRVIQIMREYYDTVGNAAQVCGGTIKDQAGDGVLILVGAPTPFADHAQRGLDLAQRIRIDGMALTARCSDADMQLGIGVGVASGYVTVGVIGSASRLEYTAVGPAVNLAARLCAEAVHGEVLVDARTTDMLRAAAHECGLRPGQQLQLKGYRQPVPCFVLEATGKTAPR